MIVHGSDCIYAKQLILQRCVLEVRAGKNHLEHTVKGCRSSSWFLHSIVITLKPTCKGRSSGSMGIHPPNTDINIAGTEVAFLLAVLSPFSTQQPVYLPCGPSQRNCYLSPCSSSTTALTKLITDRRDDEGK